jgi:hypothetical protein
MKNYRQLSNKIKGQLNPEGYEFEKAFSDELSSISYSDALTFIRFAMKGVEPEYTKRTREAGEKVKQHLDRELSNKEFSYQGSVMTDTHIKGYSDIDLLVISNKFYCWDSYSVNQILSSDAERGKYKFSSIQKLEEEKSCSTYKGDANTDLRKLRLDSEETLANVYSICDTTNAKAIKIKNLNLNREVDVVIANWYDDVRSIINSKGENRGIQVYNKETNTKENVDYPFLSIQRINQRSSETNGRLKKMIRFMKNVKAHSGVDIKLSSFDINAVCYAIETYKYAGLAYYELVAIVYSQLWKICNDREYADNLISVDGREYIFRYEPQKIENLKLLMSEIQVILADLKGELIYE